MVCVPFQECRWRGTLLNLLPMIFQLLLNAEMISARQTREHSAHRIEHAQLLAISFIMNTEQISVHSVAIVVKSADYEQIQVVHHAVSVLQ